MQNEKGAQQYKTQSVSQFCVEKYFVRLICFPTSKALTTYDAWRAKM
jgi:hypothetical protein